MRIWPGRPNPIGATWDGHGVNFALYSRNAEGVALCLFDDDGKETQRIPLHERTDFVWHAYLPDIRPGQRFGYRVGDPAEDLSKDDRDSASDTAKCIVVDPAFTWGDDRAPATPWNRTVI